VDDATVGDGVEMPLEEDRPGTAFPHWPAGIQARGEVRSQYAHAIDIAPTVLEALGVEAPAQVPQGRQVPIEVIGHRSTYHDGWRAVRPSPATSPRTTIPDGAGWTVVPWWYVLAVPAIPIAVIASVIGWLVASTLQHRATRHQSGPAPASSCIPPR
jgi:hypothetical protein